MNGRHCFSRVTRYRERAAGWSPATVRIGFTGPGGFPEWVYEAGPRRPSSAQAAFLLSTHLAFISAESLFRVAALIGRRAVEFLDVGLRFCFAHHAFLASPILARAAALMWRRFRLVDGAFCGRPRRALELTPIRAAIACSMRASSCLSCSTILSMFMFSFHSSQRELTAVRASRMVSLSLQTTTIRRCPGMTRADR